MIECERCSSKASRFLKGEKYVVMSPSHGFPYRLDRPILVALCEKCHQGESQSDSEKIREYNMKDMQEIDENTYVVASVLNA